MKLQRLLFECYLAIKLPVTTQFKCDSQQHLSFYGSVWLLIIMPIIDCFVVDELNLFDSLI